MLHNYLNDDTSGDHWGVGSSTTFLPGRRAVVLAQLQGQGEQVRVALTAEQAEEMAAALLDHAKQVRQAQASYPDFSEEDIQNLSPAARAQYYSLRAAQQTTQVARATSRNSN